LKIGYLINQYPNGSCTFIRREIQALEELDVQIKRYSIRTGGIQVVEETDFDEQKQTSYILGESKFTLLKNFIKTAVAEPKKIISTLSQAYKIGKHSDRGSLIYFFYVIEACTLSAWAKKDGIQHVHAHFGTNPAAVAMFCANLGETTYSFTVHGPEEFDNPIGMGLDHKIAGAKFVIAISSFGKSQLFRFASYEDWKKIKIVHCGVDKSYIENSPRPIKDTNNFVSIGRLHEQKGQGVLIEAIKILKDKGREFTVQLLGDGPLREELEEEVAKLGIQHYINFVGWANDEQIKEHLTNSKAMLLPSFAEGLPVVLMESLAMGRPAITTKIAGIPELIEDNETGWLVTAGSAQEFAEKIETVMDLDLETLEKIGSNGREKVLEQHNINIESQKLKILFESMG